jgi:DNA replication protein DnaD
LFQSKKLKILKNRRDRKVREFTEEGYFRYKDISLEDIDIDSNVTDYVNESQLHQDSKKTTFEKKPTLEKKKENKKKTTPEKKKKKPEENFLQNFSQPIYEEEEEDLSSMLLSPESILNGNYLRNSRMNSWQQPTSLRNLQVFLFLFNVQVFLSF